MTVRTIIKGCPICRNDIRGSVKTGYYCQKCNISFSLRSVDKKLRIKQQRKEIRRKFRRNV